MSDVARHRPLRIVLVEDNPGDVRLIEEAFEDARIANALRVFSRGDEAVEYLRERGDADRPDVVMTALRLPDVAGEDVVATVQETPALSGTTVIVVTGSSAPDVLGATGADAVLRKPFDGEEFLDVCRDVGQFWIQLVDAPPDGR